MVYDCWSLWYMILMFPKVAIIFQTAKTIFSVKVPMCTFGIILEAIGIFFISLSASSGAKWRFLAKNHYICIKYRVMNLCRFLVTTLIVCATLVQAVADTYIMDYATRYSDDNGHGYDVVATPVRGDKSPFFYSVKVPDGNYRVTLELGDDRCDGVTTVRAESRRLLVENRPTRRGEKLTETFTVNKRSPRISDDENVRLKKREIGKLDWDDRLTFEINGEAPALRSITIEPADTASVTTVYLCGNSTVVDQEFEPWASWGQMVTRFFTPEVAVANYAESGESAASFLGARRLKRALRDASPGDWFFVEFGHNDQKRKGPGDGAFYSYMTNLKIFIDEVRKKGCNIVFVTPTRRRVFDAYGRSVNTHEDYPEAMRFIAAREGVPVIELNGMTAALYEALGPDDSRKALVHYPAGTFPGQTEGLEDNTHFNPYGAYQVAKCVLSGMREAAPSLYLKLRDFDGYDPAHPDDPAKFVWAPSPLNEWVKPDGN